jgi:hypothetical protein
MKTMVQARLDEETQAALDGLVRRKGWSASKVVREGIHLLASREKVAKPIKLIGIGCVDFGPGDLATNKRYLKDLGAKSMGKGWRPPRTRAR